MNNFRTAVIQFPGATCDHDVIWALKKSGYLDVVLHWHEEPLDRSYQFVVLPGGFSYSDHLRPGAIAAHSLAVQSIKDTNCVVLGICNGFQILIEAGYLPGVLLPNKDLRFICKNVHLTFPYREFEGPTHCFRQGAMGEMVLPIAHFHGNYYAPPDILKEIEENNQVFLRYCNDKEEVTPESNPNGSVNNIAGVMDKDRRIFGMMPHPERRVELLFTEYKHRDRDISPLGECLFTSVPYWQWEAESDFFPSVPRPDWLS